MKFSKSLIVQAPWVNLILLGVKVWELRSTPCQFRGRFGLIESGTGMIVGAATMVGYPRVLGALGA